MLEILKNLALQLVFTIGIIIVFGIIIWGLNKLFYKILGRLGRIICLTTGFVGTPVHEIGHAFFCLVFRHRINAIKFYQMDAKDGLLGYVDHSFNAKSTYQQIGNFFIGVGPILFGSGFILLLMYWLVPSISSNFRDNLSGITSMDLNNINFKVIGDIFVIVGKNILEIFNLKGSNIFLWIAFIVLALSISLHMNLSFLDIKGAWLGIIYILGAFIAVDVILGFINLKWIGAITTFLIPLGIFVGSFLIISIVLNFILIVVALLIKGISLLFRRTQAS